MNDKKAVVLFGVYNKGFSRPLAIAKVASTLSLLAQADSKRVIKRMPRGEAIFWFRKGVSYWGSEGLPA